MEEQHHKRGFRMKTSRDFIGDKKPKEGTINPRSLSDKRVEADNKKKDNGFCWEKDVKEAVKELKDEDVYDLAKYMHDVYEAYAKANGWKTQDSCKVDFDFLPEKNKQVMINTALQVITKNNLKINKIFGKELV